MLRTREAKWPPPTETKNEFRFMAVSTLIAFVGFDLTFAQSNPAVAMPVLAGYWMLAFMMAPAVVMVLRRPNEGAIPRLVDGLPGRRVAPADRH